MASSHSDPSSSRYQSHMSEINVTPFVDVMLVLLIIFMATAPMIQQGINIALPETKATSGHISQDPFILKIKKDKKIYIGKTEVPLPVLSKKIKAIFKERKDKHVYIQADKKIAYGFVTKILGEVKTAGVQDVSLVTAVK